MIGLLRFDKSTYHFISFTEREYRCLGQWKEDDLIYTYTERRDLIGYECFVGLITKKGDIYLKEAGNNCERSLEPLKYGMRLTQVSKCYGNPRLTWSTSQPQPAKRPKATALPRWREREMNNFIDSGAVSGHVKISPILVLALPIISSLMASLCWQWRNQKTPTTIINIFIMSMAVNVQELLFNQYKEWQKKW